jgi:hypothetical protein
LVAGWASLAAAQAPQRLSSDAEFAKAPGEQVLGTLMSGAEVEVGRSDGAWTEVTFEGWIFSRSVGVTDRDGYDLAVIRRNTENLRLAPSGAVLARLTNGALLKKVETKRAWTHVRRTAWIQTSHLAGGSVAPEGTPVGDRAELVKEAPLLGAAEGQPVGSLRTGTQTRVVGRSGDWVRVQVEGWVRESDLKSNDSRVLVGVTQAEVRADPARYIGQVVEWRVQFLAVQRADELRPEIPLGQFYLLTRGPLPEAGFVYVIVPGNKLEQFRTVPPLQEFVIRAVVKAPTTKYLPNPVVELISVVKGLQ